MRLLKGDKTRLSDSHGMAIDTKNKLLFVNNWGNISDYVCRSGRFEPPSITVYPLNADGDTPPLRVIQGPKTQLDWPGAMSVDPGDRGSVCRQRHGPVDHRLSSERTRATSRRRGSSRARRPLSYPTGVFVDAKNKEVWVTNLGNSSATVYPLTANGDVAPLRIIRSAEEGKTVAEIRQDAGPGL